jgi:hypothetical protein
MRRPIKREKSVRPGDQSTWPLLLVVIATTVLGLAWVYVGVASNRQTALKAGATVQSSVAVGE